MGERILRSRAPKVEVSTAEQTAPGQHTLESTSPTQYGAINSNGVDKTTPDGQEKQPRSNRKRVKARLPSSPKKKQKQKRDDIYDDPEAVLTTYDSPLFKDNVNIRNIMLHPKALQVLGSSTSGYQNLASDTLSTAVAAFKEDGACGHFSYDWLSEAIAATGFRAAGQTAEYEEHMFHETWHTEKETFSDDDEDGSILQNNGDAKREHDFQEPTCDKTEFPSGAAAETDTAQSGEMLCEKMEVDSAKQDEVRVDLSTHSHDMQNHSDFPEPTEATST